MKKSFLTIFLVASLSLSVFGQTDVDDYFNSDEWRVSLAVMQIGNMITLIDGTIPMFNGAVQVSPGTYMVRGTGSGGERIIVVETNNILGVVAVAFTDTGPDTQATFNHFRGAINSSHLRLENAVTTTNSIQGTLVRSSGGRKYRFSMDHTPRSQQVVVTIVRQ